MHAAVNRLLRVRVVDVRIEMGIAKNIGLIDRRSQPNGSTSGGNLPSTRSLTQHESDSLFVMAMKRLGLDFVGFLSLLQAMSDLLTPTQRA